MISIKYVIASAARQPHGSIAALYSMRLPRCARNDMKLLFVTSA